MYGETCGRKKASELKPKALGKMLARAENVLFILASEVDRYPSDILKEIVEKSNATVYKTEAAGTEKVDIDTDARYGLMEIVDRLCNEMGEEYDYIVLAGVPYHIETRVLSGLRSYGMKKVVTLNWRHQQYADLSFPNMPDAERWKKSLNEIAENL
ncbi:hypothetical protein AKJ48_00755 [candidate division MSBL1 archaeon SCGC-AAA261O19]|uniref:Uncharacterized protein n=1 Tax=candidate division MSBL1 archaeon SCGC-AAA261O19 TaxID=1698277 RepID=A0A133VET1_9EURY|nr:hypothetical protein AKJ48_00755 [candidate division MSBL1 archaeon SCGC-AAA261O19]